MPKSYLLQLSEDIIGLLGLVFGAKTSLGSRSSDYLGHLGRYLSLGDVPHSHERHNIASV
jgi:hypothetical protein